MIRPLKLDKRGRLAISEADVQKACCDLLEAHGWRVIRRPVTMPCVCCGQPTRIPGTDEGQPDVIALGHRPLSSTLHAGIVLDIEFKKRGGRLSRMQRTYHDYLRSQGFAVITVWDVDAFRAWLRAEGLI